jgi:hypothetical protein
MTSAIDGCAPSDPRKIASGERLANQPRAARFGAVPSDLRPTTPERTIWTKLRSILPLSMTRGKTALIRSTLRFARTATSRAGTSFMKPRWRVYTAVFATNSGETLAASARIASSCCSAVA